MTTSNGWSCAASPASVVASSTGRLRVGIEDVDLGGHRAPSAAGVARIRVTIAVVEWSDR